jgi:hypothetical protein
MFKFFTGSIFGIITGIILSLALIFVILGVTTTALMATGGPEPCEPGGGDLAINQANSDSFQRKWDAFRAAVDTGQTNAVTFTESEIASRAESWANEEDAPFDNMRVCIHDGAGEASGQLKVMGLTVDARIKGTLSLTGEHPKASIDDISVGNLPGFLLRPIEFAVERAIEEGLAEIEIDHDYGLTLEQGRATVAVTP